MRDDVVLGTMNGNVFTMADTLYILSEQFCPTGGIELRRIGYFVVHIIEGGMLIPMAEELFLATVLNVVEALTDTEERKDDQDRDYRENELAIVAAFLRVQAPEPAHQKNAEGRYSG